MYLYRYIYSESCVADQHVVLHIWMSHTTQPEARNISKKTIYLYIYTYIYIYVSISIYMSMASHVSQINTSCYGQLQGGVES